MPFLPAKGDHLSGAGRQWLRWSAWKSMELGVLLAALHLVLVPVAYALIWWLTGGGWSLGPTPAWFDATLWAAVPLLFAGPPLMLLADRVQARARRRHAEALCPTCVEGEAIRRQATPAELEARRHRWASRAA